MRKYQRVKPEITFDIFSIISAIGSTVLILFCILLLAKKGFRRLPNRFLAFSLLCFMASQFNVGLVFYTGLLHYVPHIIDIPYLFTILIGSSFYFYLRAINDPERSLKPIDSIHLLPFLVLFFWKLPVFLMSGEEKIDFMIRWMGGMETETDKLKEIPQAAFIIAVNVFYSILATYEVIKNFKKPNATMEQKFLNQWLFSFLSVALVILATFLAAAVSVSLFGVNVYVFFRAAPILVAIFGIVLAVKGLSYPDLICEPETANRTRKYKTLTLSESRTKKYYSSILRLMVEDKEYLNPDLNIQFFVEKLGIPRAYISFLINQVTGRKFNDFVNDFRFDHAKNLLSVCKDQPQKIIDIAFESGFNSKSTFYSYFKKKAGLSPQEFLEKYDGKTIH